jgi:AcrR family transcriptional regulator
MLEISRQQVLTALAVEPARRGQRRRRGQGQGGDGDQRGLAELSMDELAARAGVSRATLYRLFGNQRRLLGELGLQPPPTVRANVLDVALELIGRHGLAELSMDELAARAGVSRATLYRLFPGKVPLYTELVRRFSPFESIADVLETMGDRPPAEVIPTVAHTLAAAMEDHIGLVLQLLLEVSRSDPNGHAGADSQKDAARAMRTLPLVARYLAEQMAAGRLRRMDPVLAVQALTGPIVMHLLTRSPAGSQPGSDRGAPLALNVAVDELVGMWLRAMTPGDGGHYQRQQRRPTTRE